MSEAASASRPKPVSPLLLAVVIGLLLLLAVASLGGYRDLTAARARRRLLETRIEQTRARNEELAQRILRLQEDPATLERVAREQYRLMQPGDVVVVLPADSDSP